MFWGQVGVSFVLWLAIGFFTFRGIRHTRRASMNRVSAALLVAVLFLAGVALLIGGMAIGISTADESGLSLLGWLAVTISGSLCIFLQSFGAKLAIGLAIPTVTRDASATSTNQNNDRSPSK